MAQNTPREHTADGSFFSVIRAQKGAFSPFMFGLLASVAVFSSLMQKWSMDEMKRQEERRIQTQQEQAESVAKAVENAILTETATTYGNTVTLERARQFMSGTTGIGGDGEDYQFKSAQTDSQFGRNNQRIIINTTDDQFLKDEIGRIEGEEGIKAFAGADGTTVLDTSDARKRQITKSRESLEMEAAQIYRSYASFGFKFPSTSQYSEIISAATGIKDVWGQDLTYERQGDKKATLSFTTPWGYTVTKKLSMD